MDDVEWQFKTGSKDIDPDLPKRRCQIWKFEVTTTNETSLSPPAFVVAISDYDPAYAQFWPTTPGDVLTKCYWPGYPTPCISTFANESDIVEFNSTIYGRIWYISHMPDPNEENYTALWQKQLLQVFTNWDSGAIINGYQTDTAQLPYYYYAIFDPTREFEQSLECGLIALHEMPAIGSNSFLLTPSFYNDTILKVLPRNTTNPDCYNLSRSYYEYDVKLSSTGISNYSACDKNHTSTGTCISQAMIRYSTFDLQTFKIVQGMSATDILTDEGGIIGGIAFLFWIFTIWTQWRS